MILPWVFATMLSVLPVNTGESLLITKDGQPITSIHRTDLSYPYSELPIMNGKKYKRFIEELDKQFYLEPKNAVLDSRGRIIPEKIGTQIHHQLLTEQIYSYFFGGKITKMEIPLLPVYPKIDSELLGDIRSTRIGRYVTSFNPHNKNRSNNLKLAAKAINNYVVFPGETFSFNQVVGKRTAAKGYLRAPVIVRGEYSEDIGGGICQVSSTLFNAIDNAGLKIVERFSHSRKVPYIPPGRDATVSWYGPDFKFKNRYNQPVLIQAKTLGNLLVIKLYSSDRMEYIPRKIPNPSY